MFQAEEKTGGDQVHLRWTVPISLAVLLIQFHLYLAQRVSSVPSMEIRQVSRSLLQEPGEFAEQHCINRGAARLQLGSCTAPPQRRPIQSGDLNPAVPVMQMLF